jgi:hypothetical protein
MEDRLAQKEGELENKANWPLVFAQVILVNKIHVTT